VDEEGAQEAAADADRDHLFDGLAGDAQPLAVADLGGGGLVGCGWGGWWGADGVVGGCACFPFQPATYVDCASRAAAAASTAWTAGCAAAYMLLLLLVLLVVRLLRLLPSVPVSSPPPFSPPTRPPLPPCRRSP